MHLDDGQIERLMDRELSAADERRAREHLADCAACRARADEAVRDGAELRALLRSLDHPLAGVTARDVVARATRARPRVAVGWAASILLAIGLAGVAYAAPGSPLPGWIAALAQAAGVSRQDSPPDPAESPRLPAELAGIAVAAGERLVVSFRSAQDSGHVLVSLDAGATEVSVRGPADAATFTADPERVVVENRGPGADYAVTIPLDAPLVEVRVADALLFRKQGGEIRAGVSPDSISGTYRLPLRP